MRTRLCGLAATTILLATGTAAAAQELSWQAWLGQVPIATVRANYAPDPGRYRMTASVDTGGPMQQLFPWGVNAETVGRMTQGLARPDRFRFDSMTAGRPRHMAIDFGPNGARVARAEPPVASGVPMEATRGAFDPMTAFVHVGRALAAGQGCNMTVPVFEGRWRYDLVLRDHGREQLQPTAMAPVGGQAHRCEVGFRPVAGFDPRQLAGWENVSGRAWFLPSGGPGPWFPVRIEADLPMAMVTIAMQRPPTGG